MLFVSAMTTPLPERIFRRRATTLDEFHGEWTDVLKQTLMDCGCSTRIPVRIYSIHDGRVLAKYRILLLLPAELGLGTVLPSGEALTMSAALEIALVEAVTRIREHKVQQIGPSFVVVPHDAQGTEPPLNHLSLVRDDPVGAARFMDRYWALLSSYHSTHKALVHEMDHMLEEFTSRERMIERRRVMDEDVRNPNLATAA